ncbi:MAG: hypothetical protein ACRDQ5_16585, partial [Sciscionella sp.]
TSAYREATPCRIFSTRGRCTATTGRRTRASSSRTPPTRPCTPLPAGVALRTLLIQQTQRTLARLHRDYPAGRCSDYHLAQTADQLERVAASLREANKAFGEPG